MDQPLLNATTSVYAILGDPISHSLSPVIMNAMFRRLGMDKAFLALRMNRDKTATIFPALKQLDFAGYVLTMPVKEVVPPYLDQLQAEAELTGVVNCIVNQNGTLIGHNTDSRGFWTAVLEKTGNAAPRSVFLLGAGGFAKAAAAQAAIQGVRTLYVANPADSYAEKFRQFGSILEGRFPGLSVSVLNWLPEQWTDALAQTDLIVNATPNGLHGDGDLHTIFPYHAVKTDAVFFDAIYDPLETHFLAAARQRGHRTVEGLDLLAHQGICSFKLWTGVDVDAATMKQDALTFLQRH